MGWLLNNPLADLIGWVLRHAYALYLQWIVDLEEEELFDRTCDFSASDTWAARVRLQINRRLDEIAALRAPRVRYSLRNAAR